MKTTHTEHVGDPNDQDVATVRDVLRVFGGRHACAAFDRIVSATQTRQLCGDVSPPLPKDGSTVTCALAAGHAGHHSEVVGDYPLLWARASDGGSDGGKPKRPSSMPPTQAELTATLAGNASKYEPEPSEDEE